MRFHEIGTAQLPLRLAIPAVVVAIGAMMLVEWRALGHSDPVKPHRISCIGCHADKRTLQAIADKADDPLYLVHSGELTLAELNRLQSKPGPAHTWKLK